jgi:ketosteroid isomerase-like protein
MIPVHPAAGLALALTLIAAIGTAQAVPQPTAAGPQEAPPAIALPPPLDRVLRDYETAWRDGNGARMAALFTEDGYAVQNGAEIRRGREAIARGITRPGGSLQLTAFAYSASGTIGYIIGGYRYPDTVGAGGRFVLALRSGPDGRWLIAADLDNAGPRR